MQLIWKKGYGGRLNAAWLSCRVTDPLGWGGGGSLSVGLKGTGGTVTAAPGVQPVRDLTPWRPAAAPSL